MEAMECFFRQEWGSNNCDFFNPWWTWQFITVSLLYLPKELNKDKCTKWDMNGVLHSKTSQYYIQLHYGAKIDECYDGLVFERGKQSS